MKLQNAKNSKINVTVNQNWRCVHVLRRGRSCKRCVYVVDREQVDECEPNIRRLHPNRPKWWDMRSDQRKNEFLLSLNWEYILVFIYL